MRTTRTRRQAPCPEPKTPEPPENAVKSARAQLVYQQWYIGFYHHFLYWGLLYFRATENKMSNGIPSRDDFTSLWGRPGYLVRRLHQIHVAMFLEECSDFNVTPVQFAVLTVLYNEKTLDQVTIANQIGVDRNTVADVIRRLERRGVLERPASIADKRAKLARITKEGRIFVESVQPAMIRAQRRLVKTLSDDEHDTLMTLLGKLIQENNESSRAPMRPTNGQ